MKNTEWHRDFTLTFHLSFQKTCQRHVVKTERHALWITKLQQSGSLMGL